jgi:hypothetical protein
MTRKSNGNVLALPPLAPDSGLTASASLMPWSPHHARTREQKRMLEHGDTQMLAIGVTAAKTCYGDDKIGEIHRHVAAEFDETVNCIIAIKDRPGRTPQHQAFVDQFCEHSIQLLAQHSFGVLEVGAAGIGMIVHETPYPPPEPEPRPGFLQRVFGGS